MSKLKKKFVCNDCGSVYGRWAGKCDNCGEWDSIVEEVEKSSHKTNIKSLKGSKKIEFHDLDGSIADVVRIDTHIDEMNRVLGSGLVPGSAILIGGDPGIGKSTLLLSMVAKLANAGAKCAYISGEESISQIRLRAKRMGISNSPVKLAAATSVKDILATISDSQHNIIVIDSIQTMFVAEISSAPGTVSQIRASAHELISVAKQQGIILLIVGHVTKDGQIAGPKILEHMVDTVLYFEGERGHQFRILRAVKNRFGAANEIGVFEMREEGLREVPNPSALFISDHKKNVSGSVVFAGIEGTRPVLAEVQALVSPSYLPTPRRAVVGWDSNRLAMIIAVLQTRYGISFGDKEVYLNIAGGLKVTEPAVDLAVAAALISAATDTPVPQDHVIFGEIGLSGEVRMVSHSDVRLKEAVKLGFSGAIVPSGVSKPSDLNVLELYHISQMKDFFPK
jgi:DNA repair protein RadA/Sms